MINATDAIEREINRPKIILLKELSNKESKGDNQ